MKKAIVTRVYGSSTLEMNKLTHPYIQKYADKCDAEFEIITNEKPIIIGWDGAKHYTIFDMYDLFDKYDRILHVDSDILITPSCPDLFEVVPEDAIGFVYEDVGTRTSDRRNEMKAIQEEWGDIGWITGFGNTGVQMTSKTHKDIFKPYDTKIWEKGHTVQTHIDYLIIKYGYKIHELPFTYNHMSMFSEPWNNNADRFDSYIIHYAGVGTFNTRVNSKLIRIKKDIRQLYGN